ncbi:MAG: extensin family protein [Pseudomonadota bacterium]
MKRAYLILTLCGLGLSGCAVTPDRSPDDVAEGALCGDPRLTGKVLTAIESSRAGCGIAAPIALSGIGAVVLKPAAVVDCQTARTLADWTVDAERQTRAATGQPLARLRIAASYACRGINGRPGARLSEHAKGKAVDISALGLADGREITVLEGWGGRQGTLLRRLWRTACGPFGTVLGPEADRFHRDHFHFDRAERRQPYCR